MIGNVQRRHHFVGNFNALLIHLRDQRRHHTQTCLGTGIAQIVENAFKSLQRTPRPGLADLTEEMMLNGVPLGATRRIMTYRDFDGETLGELFLIVI